MNRDRAVCNPHIATVLRCFPENFAPAWREPTARLLQDDTALFTRKALISKESGEEVAEYLASLVSNRGDFFCRVNLILPLDTLFGSIVPSPLVWLWRSRKR